ncbi:hypothetical protein ERO13_D07G014250v2 [Gossypium hirsutum]|nr:hypothetical protein ERO13_D07G014250v2 [Gossypium hirsutum]
MLCKEVETTDTFDELKGSRPGDKNLANITSETLFYKDILSCRMIT